MRTFVESYLMEFPSTDGVFSYFTNVPFPVQKIEIECAYALQLAVMRPALCRSSGFDEGNLPLFSIGSASIDDTAPFLSADGFKNKTVHTFNQPREIKGAFDFEVKDLNGALPTNIELGSALVKIIYIST